MSTYKLVSKIVETAPAWVECEACENGGVPTMHTDYYGERIEEPCGLCHGTGGSWNEAIYQDVYAGSVSRPTPFLDETRVDKSSTLIREWEVCGQCGGDKDYDRRSRDHQACSRCQGTGAEPDTAGDWRVG